MRVNKLVTNQRFIKFKSSNNTQNVTGSQAKIKINGKYLDLDSTEVPNYQSLIEASEKMKKSIESLMSSSLMIFAEHIKNAVPNNGIEVIKDNIRFFADFSKEFIIPNIISEGSFLDLAKSILDAYSGENLKHKLQSVEKWADYGWILYPELTVDEIFSIPDTQEEADTLVLSMFDENEMITNLNEIKLNRFIKDFVIDDIAMLFEKGSYYSCILLSVVSIEGVLLNYMKQDNNHNGIQTNIKSKHYAKTLFRNITEYEKKLITYFNACNLKRLVGRLVENNTGNNWENEPDYILRDYLCHGMSTKEWQKIDAIKMILLLIELSDFVENRLREQSS